MPDLKLYYSHSNKNSMVLAQKQTHHQWDRTEDLEKNPQSYIFMIFSKEPKMYIRE
jgi:hypothetical protein